MTFELSQEVNHEKIFLVRTSVLNGRVDPFFYIPELVNLDNLIKSKTNFRLSDFALSYSSGATPSKDNADFYSDKENGIPFIRVQNLSITGILSLDDLIYISTDVHEKMLKRSQVEAGDLLIKITGVGRMAIASVAPDDFKGNINQHIVVIKTQSKEVSENLAAFINLDSIEKLASKRSAGGTRPALDYTALFSLPIINDRSIYTNVSHAVLLFGKKNSEANRLLASINDYLLSELGISLPKQDNSLDKRMFFSSLKDVSGGRFDSDFHRVFYKHLTLEFLEKTKVEKIKDISLAVFQGVGKDEVKFSEFKLLKVKNIKQNNEIDFSEVEYIKHVPHRKILCFNDIISPFIGEAVKQYKFSIFVEKQGKYTVDNNTGVIRINTSLCNPIYICDILNSVLVKFQIDRYLGGGGVPFLGANSVKEILIPIVPIEKQNEIAAHIQSIREQAAELQREAVQILEDAKVQIERMILGDSEV